MKTTAILLLILAAPTVYAESRWTLSADAWARPRSGRAVAAMEPLPEVARQWSAQSGQTLLIRYPGGEEGQLWAHELRSWLVALGIPLRAQELVAGSHSPDRIEIELVTR